MIAGLYIVPDKSIAPGGKNLEPVSYNMIFQDDTHFYHKTDMDKSLYKQALLEAKINCVRCCHSRHPSFIG